MTQRWQTILGVAYVLTFVTITLLCLAMGTERWVNYKVDRITMKSRFLSNFDVYDALFSHKIYWTRHRGLYRTCYTDRQFPSYFPSSGKTNGDIICYSEDGYNFNSADNITDTDGAKGDYQKRSHLLRAVSAMFALSLLSNLISFCVAIVGSCRRLISSSKYSAMWATFGSLFTIAGMGMFHGVHVMETNTIKLREFKAGWSSMNQHRYLAEYTTIDFGYSYMMGWVAAGVNLFSVMFYLFAAFSLADYTRRIQEMTSLVSSDAKAHIRNAYNAKRPAVGMMYGRADPFHSQDIYGTKKNDAADEFFVADAGRNEAYDLAASQNRIVQEDRPGESDSINEQIRPVQRHNVEPESWYDKERRNNPKDDRRDNRRDDWRYDDRRPPARHGDRSSADKSRDYRENRISHPLGYGHNHRGRYREFY